MNQRKTNKTLNLSDFNKTESITKKYSLYVALIIATLSTLLYALNDAFNQRFSYVLISFGGTIIFGLFFLIIIIFPKTKNVVNIIFVSLIGLIFILLLFSQFSDSATVFWCFIFPLVAMFLLGKKAGLIMLISYNAGIILVFFIDIAILKGLYTYENAIRYYGAMLAVSILSYYYESLRNRSLSYIYHLNESLEMQVIERTKQLELSQEKLRQSERLESLGLLAGGIAHDFNNHLTGIIGFADLIEQFSKNNPDINSYAKTILTSARRSAELTGKLLSFARKGNFIMTNVDIHSLVLEVISILKRTVDKRIVIIEELKAESKVIKGDSTQLMNSILNIAINACDAMVNGGDLSFLTENIIIDESSDKTQFSELQNGNYLKLSVKDTGIGMDKSVMEHIFEPFFTTKEHGRGSGMGLAAVYGTVKSHRGVLSVESAPGAGSTFIIYLPVINETINIIQENSESSLNVKFSGHILLVDDEDLICESQKNILRVLGFSVSICRNGKEAVDYYSKNWQSIDLVILDIIMPIMGGKDCFIEMKKINPDIKVLISSGYSQNGDAQAILDMGANAFIQKPFTISQIRDKLSQIIKINN